MRLSPQAGATAKMPEIVARSDALYASGKAGRGFRTMGDDKRNCVMVAKGAPFAPAHAPPRRRAAAPPRRSYAPTAAWLPQLHPCARLRECAAQPLVSLCTSPVWIDRRARQPTTHTAHRPCTCTVHMHAGHLITAQKYRSGLRKLECELEGQQRVAGWHMLRLAASVELKAGEWRRPQMLRPLQCIEQSREVLAAAAILAIAPVLAPVQTQIWRMRKTHAGAPCPCGRQRSLCDSCKGVKCGGVGDCSNRQWHRCSLCRKPTRSLCSKPVEVQRRLRRRLQKLGGTAPPSASVPPASGPPPASVPAAGPQTHMCLRSRTSSARAPELKAGSEADSEADSEEKGEEEEGCEEGAQAGGEESGDESGDPSAATPAIAPAVTAITPAATAPAAFTATTPAFATLLLAVEASARKDEAALAEMVPPAEEEVAMDDAGVMEVEVVWDGELD